MQFNSIVVLGPTASGKTRLASQLAYFLDGEVISADSRQVYRTLDIGTGKDLEEFEVYGKKIPYHLIDIAEPGAQFYLHNFMAALRQAFETIRSNKKLPIVCGGTGLYLDALRKDFSFTIVPEDESLREDLESKDKMSLLLELRRLSPTLADSIDSKSKKRIIRGIEIARYIGDMELPHAKDALPYYPFYIGINLDPEERRARIARRLEQRLNSGLIEEVEKLLGTGISHERLQRLGLEYKFLSQHLLGKLSREEFQKKLVIAIAQFAKRQMTWFRKMEKEGVQIHWVGPFVDVKALASDLKHLFAS